jgi:hypothetical protein
LTIALLILSVAYGVFEAGRRNGVQSAATLNLPVFATKLGLKNTVTSALVNVSNGGENTTLATNLDEYASFVGNQSHFGKCTILSTALDASPYESGIWISWGSDGTGVSSAYANFTLVFTGTTSDAQMEHAVNVTTGLEVEGTYVKLAGTNKQVSVTCTIYNEGEFASASNITLFYDFDGDLLTQDWTPVTSPSVTDYGTGTYTISCTADTEIRDDPVLLSAHVYDLRDIFVIANCTCSEASYDYVDNNISNVDSSADIGTHSAFAAQQVGPDSVYDTLTEGNTGNVLTNYTLVDAESFEGSWPPTDWIATGNWNKETDQYYDGSYSADFDGEGNGVDGNLTTAELDCSDAVSIYVSFEFYDESLDPNELHLEYFDGTSWVEITDLGSLYTEGTWNLYEQKITDSRYFVSNFMIRWEAIDVESGGGGNNEHAYVDLVTVSKEAYSPDNYELDLEVQWINADFDETNEELCIYMGSTSGENLMVEAWTGSSWDSLTTLNVGWNNVTVTSYLTSSTFNIRFIGETETGDTSQDYWTIDVTLLDCWS